MMNNNIFEMASKVVFGGEYVADGHYGNYCLIKVGKNIKMLYKGKEIFNYNGVTHSNLANGKNQEKAVYTVMVVLGLAD